MSVLNLCSNAFKVLKKDADFTLYNIGSFNISSKKYEEYKDILYSIMTEIEHNTPLKFTIYPSKKDGKTIIDYSCYQSEIDDVMQNANLLSSISEFKSLEAGLKQIADAFAADIATQVQSIVKVKDFNLTKEMINFLDFHKRNYLLDYYVSNGFIYLSLNVAAEKQVFANNIKKCLRVIVEKDGILLACNFVMLLTPFFVKGEMPHSAILELNFEELAVDTFAFLLFENYMDINQIDFYLAGNMLHVFSKSDDFKQYLAGDKSCIKMPSPDTFIKEVFSNI